VINNVQSSDFAFECTASLRKPTASLSAECGVVLAIIAPIEERTFEHLEGREVSSLRVFERVEDGAIARDPLQDDEMCRARVNVLDEALHRWEQC